MWKYLRSELRPLAIDDPTFGKPVFTSTEVGDGTTRPLRASSMGSQEPKRL